MSDTFTVGKRLVELCKQQKNMEAIQELYADEIVSLEAMSGPDMPAQIEGIQAVKGKAEWWENNHEIHSAEADGPYPNGDRFVVRFKYDVTAKAGPMAGKKMLLEEAALYTVSAGKIVKEEFFYHMAG